LVIKLGALGDFVLALGAMAAVRRHHPEATLTLLTTKPLDELVAGSGWFDQIWIDRRPRRFDLAGWWNLRRRLRGGGFQRVYDFQNNDRTALYFRLCAWPDGGPEWSGLVSGCSHRFCPPVSLTHASDWQRTQLLSAGLPAPQSTDLAWLGDASVGVRFSLTDGGYVLLIPGCARHRPEKRWPAEGYATLARAILNEGRLPVLLGTAAEAEVTQAISAAAPGCLDLTGQTRLTDLPALARGAAAAVGNDTGPMHLIGPTGCPTLVLFSCHSQPHLARPLGPAVALLVQPNLTDLPTAKVLAALATLPARPPSSKS